MVLVTTGSEEVERLVQAPVEVTVEVAPGGEIRIDEDKMKERTNLTNSLMMSLYCLWRFWNSWTAAKRSILRPTISMRSAKSRRVVMNRRGEATVRSDHVRLAAQEVLALKTSNITKR